MNKNELPAKPSSDPERDAIEIASILTQVDLDALERGRITPQVLELQNALLQIRDECGVVED